MNGGRVKLEDKAILSPRLRVWREGEWWLYFDSHNFVWVRVNASGRFLLEELRKYRTPEQVASEVADRFGVDPAKSRKLVRRFIEGLVEQGFLHWNRYREDRPQVPQQPDFAQIAYILMTDNCNLTCSYCFNKEERETNRSLRKQGSCAPVLTTEELKALVARLVELGVGKLVVTGGEPLLHPDTIGLLEFARSQSLDLEIELQTNAALLTQESAERLCRVVDEVTISLDGHQGEVHERHRGKNSFRPTIEGIKTLLAVRDRLAFEKPRVTLASVITADNVAFMNEIHDFALTELGADRVTATLFQPNTNQEAEIRQVPIFADWASSQNRGDRFSQRPDDRGEDDGVPQFRPSLRARQQCKAGSLELSVDPSGKVFPCRCLHHKEFACGDLRSADIKEIYASSAVMKRMRASVVDDSEVCRYCDVRSICTGGCRGTNHQVYGDFEAHNELYCRYLERGAIAQLWATTRSAGSGESSCH